MKISFCKTVNYLITARFVIQTTYALLHQPSIQTFFYDESVESINTPSKLASVPDTPLAGGQCQVSLLRLNSVRLTISSFNDHVLTIVNCPWIYRLATRSWPCQISRDFSLARVSFVTRGPSPRGTEEQPPSRLQRVLQVVRREVARISHASDTLS